MAQAEGAGKRSEHGLLRRRSLGNVDWLSCQILVSEPGDGLQHQSGYCRCYQHSPCPEYPSDPLNDRSVLARPSRRKSNTKRASHPRKEEVSEKYRAQCWVI